MSVGEVAQVVEEHEAGPVAEPHGVPGRQHEDPHGTDASGATDLPTITVAICSRDGAPQDLDTLVRALLPQLQPGDDLRMIDSASRGSVVGDVARAHGLPCDRLDRPGVSRARNHALEAATTSGIAFVDDDCRPDPHWLAAVRRGLRSGASAVFGRVEPADGSGVAVSVLVATDPYDLQLGQLDRAGHGANLATDRRIALEVGGFDPLLGAGAFFPGAEDKDLMARLVAAGHTVRYRPDAVVFHRPRPTRVAALRAAHGYGVGSAAADRKLRGMGLPAQRPAAAAARRAVAALRGGYRFGIVLEATFAVGVAVGTWRSRPLVVADGRLVRGRT